jgi:hypothetical protein
MGSIQIGIKVSRSNLAEKLAGFSSLVDKADDVVERVAQESLGNLVTATPVRYTGDTRKQWVRRTLGVMMQVLANPSKVMFFLERGTKAHGPKTAKALFIPLNRRAWEAGPKGVMEANARAVVGSVWRSYNAAVGGKRVKVKKPYVQGQDFVWAKRVRGIKAMHIARDEQKRAKKSLKQGMVELLRKALR